MFPGGGNEMSSGSRSAMYVHLLKEHRILLVLVVYSSCAIGAFGRSSSSLRSLTGERAETMSFLAWVVLGLIAGFIGGKLVNRRGEGILLDILLGVIALLHVAGCSTSLGPLE
jgi:ABC-type uncharacterized transport system permease subunit